MRGSLVGDGTYLIWTKVPFDDHPVPSRSDYWLRDRREWDCVRLYGLPFSFWMTLFGNLGGSVSHLASTVLVVFFPDCDFMFRWKVTLFFLIISKELRKLPS
jgi:hypothetical protein